MRTARLFICIGIYILLCSKCFSQTASRVAVTGISTNINTGQDYSPWLNDDTTKLVADVWSPANAQYVDVKLKLAATTNVTELSLYDYEGVFTATPAYIYAVKGTVRTLIATFTGPSYMVWENVMLTTPVAADTIIIHKYENCFPGKIKIYGTPAGLATPITGNTAICIGSTKSLSNATSGGTWASGNTAVAIINATGVATGVSAGTATISYTVAGLMATAILTVNPLATVGSINGTVTVYTGATTSLTDSISGGAWSSSATGIATIGATGIVTGVAAGTATISYKIVNACGTATASKMVTVSVPAVAAIAGAATVCAGASATLSDATAGGVWSSSAATVATVSSAGKVTGVSAGTATIKYTVGTAAATRVVTVTAQPVAGTVSGAATVNTGATTILTDATTGGAWSSSATGNATVGTSGIVTGVAAGTATISYKVTNTCGSATATKVVTVSAASVGAINGTAMVCAGGTAVLSDATQSGNWSSSVTSVATVSAAGIVTGIAAGTTTISYTVGTRAATRIVTVNALPVAGSVTGTATITAGATTALNDAAGAGVWSSNATGIAIVNTSGVVIGVAAGAATISYSVTNSCGTAVATEVITVTSATGGGGSGSGSGGSGGTLVHGKIPIDGNRWYQLDNTSNGLQGLFDGDTMTQVLTGWGKILSTYDAYYPVLPGEQINIDSIRFYDGTGSTYNPFYLYYIDSAWNRVLIATYTAGHYNTWVGPNNSTTNFALTVPANNIKYLLITCTSDYPNEMELYGSYIAPAALPAAPAKTITLKQETGVNCFEWDFEDPNAPDVVDPVRMATIKSFGAIRHYLDWSKLEPNQGGYTFNPSHSGSWNYDTMYARCKTEGIDVLVDIKTQPTWMQATYPTGADAENVPVMYGADFTNPASYILQAKLAFQFAARYGYNASVSPSLLSVDASTRWTGDPANVVKTGLGLITYVECDNERDKWWKGRAAYQTGREYAANMSAFYDGNKNTMGPGVGVKNADPSMQVVMAGVADPVPDYFKGMIDWCKQYRGYNADGSVNLCWDVINYHIYPNNSASAQGSAIQGMAPEVAHMDTVASSFINAAHVFAKDMQVWVTESGYDLNQGSPQRAVPIGSKTAAQTQADWILRNSLLYARMGVARTFFYMVDDQDTTNPTQYSSSGLIINNTSRRPAADYLYQANKLMGNYVYVKTISTNPLIDQYELNGNAAYVLVKPSQDGSTIPYTMHFSTPGAVHIYNPAIGQDTMSLTIATPDASNALALTVTETPMFIIPNPGTSGARTSAPGTAVNTPVTAPQPAIAIFPNPGKRACAVFNRSVDRIITVRIEESVMINDHLEKRVRAIEKIGPRDRKFVGYAGCEADVLGERCMGFRILVAYYDDASRIKNAHYPSRISSVSTADGVNGVANATPVHTRNL